MAKLDRRTFLRFAGGALATASMPASIREALAIPADVRSGTIMDVEHVVILMQENRSFDHYFGTLPGVRGFGDRFPIPLATGKPVWFQRGRGGREILPYHLDGTLGNAQRVDGAPHDWASAHHAWDEGRTGYWPAFKKPHSMGYYKEQELPFQFALANAFTICEAYHCSIQSSTNPNRLFMFTGTNDPLGIAGGPAIDNTNDDLGSPSSGFRWTTYAERLERAGVSWKVYQDMDDNFTDNPLEGFRTFRDAYENDPSSPLVLKGLTSTLRNSSLDGLRNDVLAGKLPHVSYLIAPAEYCEHPEPSSPVQAAWYVHQVIESLAADPAVWSRTVLLVMFDENDGFFDHVPPPCPPSRNPDGSLAGASTVDDTSERHAGGGWRDSDWISGLGPRVPMYVISPWSRGGWVNSQVFDHTSIIRFLEKRFGVHEPNISPWRRAVCGDLTSAFNFAEPNADVLPALPAPSKVAADSHRREQEQSPQVPVSENMLPRQPRGLRLARALPYELHVLSFAEPANGRIRLQFVNSGAAGAVFHVYNLLDLAAVPRRYTVEASKSLSDVWAFNADGYDLWVVAPNGFHRQFQGAASAAIAIGSPEAELHYDSGASSVFLTLKNPGTGTRPFTVIQNAYHSGPPQIVTVRAGGEGEVRWAVWDSGHWYDVTVIADGADSVTRRFAGHLETGKPSISDPAMGTIEETAAG